GHRRTQQSGAGRGGCRNRLRQRREDKRSGRRGSDTRKRKRHRRLPDRDPQRRAQPATCQVVRRLRLVVERPGHPRSRRIREGVSQARIPGPLLALAAAGLLLFLVPLAALIVRAPWDQVGPELVAPETTTALGLSLFCSLSATALALILGVPLALLLSRTTGTVRAVLRALTTLPMVLPPVVGGVALLLAFGRRGLAGAPLYTAFGATITFAGNLPGRTQTVPLAVYVALETKPEGAIVLSLILLAVSLAILVGLRDRWLGA